MNILILGSGGREHAFAWKIKQSPLCKNLYVLPGNAGTAQIAENVAIQLNNFAKIAHFVLDNHIDLVLVGPEEPLVKGIKDFFAESELLKNIPIIGPDKDGAMLEGSKDFSKNFMHRHHIPTAQSKTFTAETLRDGIAYLQTHALPIVVKADGLAAGKGVIIAQSIAEAQKTLEEMLLNEKFGEASRKVIIEEYLNGIELSVFVLTDGVQYKILPEAKDYKRIGEGDTGLNTGGMGAISPVPFADAVFMEKVKSKIVEPTLKGLKSEKINYQGFIFVGLMNVGGEPYVIEYNARMGDPETQSVLARIDSDFLELLLATAEHRLTDFELKINPQTAATVVLVSGGYPENYEKGKQINNLRTTDEVFTFHSGTALGAENQFLTNGGRVFALTALGGSIQEAVLKCIALAEEIEFEGVYFRRDIGKDLMGF